MAALGDKITTQVEIDGVPYEVKDEREPGESNADFVNRHIAHVRAFLRDHGVT